MEKEAFRSAPFIGRRGAAVVSVPYFTFPPYVLLVDLPSPDRIGLFPLRFAGFTLFSCALWFVRISCECRFCLFSSCGEGNNRSLRRRPTFAPSVIRSRSPLELRCKYQHAKLAYLWGPKTEHERPGRY
ncbi:hypothetical protein B0T24DRAFT_23857 [Lasiosphaeria ovina]|uniref:Uncharacterized protein n=1 Tax=Lasiosphaeria ovina TaxID=92902 RepID=A0AAE0NJS9_9PEZI|nr:hypothetical protein B0T24DRAFT_23857 [Lasiosphaeria ovina]